MNSEPTRIVSNKFEIEKDGKVGYLQFDTDDRGWMTIWHTEVPPELRGHGIASELVKTAFEYARENQLQVDMIWPIATSLAVKYPEYQALIGKK
jgi:predicted GNAT family acetyltransferase